MSSEADDQTSSTLPSGDMRISVPLAAPAGAGLPAAPDGAGASSITPVSPLRSSARFAPSISMGGIGPGNGPSCPPISEAAPSRTVTWRGIACSRLDSAKVEA